MKEVGSENLLAFAFNSADVIFFCRWAETHCLPLKIYVISAGGSQSYQYLNNKWTSTFSLSDFWSEIGAQISDKSGRLTIKIINDIQHVMKDKDSFIADKISSLCGKFSTQHLWPFLRAKFEISLVLKQLEPQKILYRGVEKTSLKAFGSGTDAVSKFVSYFLYHRWHLLSEAKHINIDVLYFSQSKTDIIRKFIHDHLIGKGIFCYKWLSLTRLFLASLTAKIRDKNKLARYHTLLISHSTVHDDVLSRLDLVGPVLHVLDYSVGVQHKTQSVRFEVLELSKHLSPSDFWRTHSQSSSVGELLVHSDISIVKIFKDFFNLNPEFYVYRNALSRLIRITRPQKVYLGNDQVTNSSMVARYCMKNDIPSITVQHGWISAPPVNNIPLVSKYFEYYNNFSKTILSEYVADSSLILNKKSTSGVKNFPEKSLKFDTVILIVQAFKPYKDMALNSFINLARDLPDITFIVRLSPRENLNKYNSKLYNLRYDNHSSVVSLFSSSCLVIGFNSTMLYEAMLVGCPILTVDMPFESVNPFITSVNLLPIDRDWKTCITNVINDEARVKKLIAEQLKLLFRFTN